MTDTVYTLKWGILSTGFISKGFAKDLLIDPSTREQDGIRHEIVAVASRSQQSADKFVAEVLQGRNVKAYANYQALYDDPDVQAIYIGTPHSHHYQNVKLALEAGKSILCEKSLTVNAEQAQALVDLARNKGVFFMEAVWTRFQPVSYKVQEILKSGVLGQIRAVHAELSMDVMGKPDTPKRLVVPELAGGALLDVGPYPWTWLALLLLPPSKAAPQPMSLPKIASSIILSSSGVDEHTVAAIQFPQEDGRTVHGSLITSLTTKVGETAVSVQGSRGYLQIKGPAYRPHTVTYQAWESDADLADNKSPSKSDSISFDKRPGDIWGFAWEADEVARCIRDGKRESDRMPLRETILMMQVFDEIRRQNNWRYPEDIETLESRELP